MNTSSRHKTKDDSGRPSFWDHFDDAIETTPLKEGEVLTVDNENIIKY